MTIPRPKRNLPTWLMGMTILPFGILGGLLVVTVPQLLAQRGATQSDIARVTEVGLSPVFWTFLLCPILDVKYSHRTYATAGAIAAALLLALALFALDEVVIATIFLTLAFVSVIMMENALGAWFSSAVTHDRQGSLSGWMMASASIGGSTAAIASFHVIDVFSLAGTAVIFGTCMLLPLLIYPFIPSVETSKREARDSFGRLSQGLRQLLISPEALVIICMFILPTAPFALTNSLSRFGSEFGASPIAVGHAGGMGSIAGIAGALLMPVLAKRIRVRWLYIGIGVVGALCTLGVLLLPRTPSTLTVAFVVEGLFQAMSLACMLAVTFETVGRDNPLAGTIFSIFAAAANFPTVYMVDVDAHAFATYGLSGSFAVDAGLGLISCALMVPLLIWARARRQQPTRLAT